MVRQPVKDDGDWLYAFVMIVGSGTIMAAMFLLGMYAAGAR